MIQLASNIRRKFFLTKANHNIYINRKFNKMIRLFLCALICSLTLFACKSDTANQSETNATSTTPSKDANQTSKKADSPKAKSLEDMVRSTLGGRMIKSVEANGSNLSIKYFKSAEELKATINNDRMNEELFEKYWSTASRIEKIMALVPSQILSQRSEVENIDMTIYTADKTYTTNINRDKLAQFLGLKWDEIQQDWNKSYRTAVINNAEKRKSFFDKFVTAK